MGLSQRDILMEVRADIKDLKVSVSDIGKDVLVATGERRSLRTDTTAMCSTLAEHNKRLDDLKAWRDRADGALMLARWALGASLVSLAAVAIQFISQFGH